MTNKIALQKHIRLLLILFMCALTASGLTAIPLLWELKRLMPFVEKGSQLGMMFPALSDWMEKINGGVQNGYGQYPFLAYGTDWLAFGHVVIAIAFLGALRDPVKNIWVIEFGIIACMLIMPWAIMFGILREIPFFWTLIDMSFGVFGIIPLWMARADTLRLQALN